ncbi:neprosin-like protein [Drosera capensis]
MNQINDMVAAFQNNIDSFFSFLKSRVSEASSSKLPYWYLDPPKGTIKTIMGDHGDIIDCVDFYKQPAFDHPRLKSHKPDLEHTKHSIDDYDSNTHPNLVQSWHMNGCCPRGTIPIRRGMRAGPRLHPFVEKLVSIRTKLEQMLGLPITGFHDGFHLYAITDFTALEDEEIQGAKATFSIWKPKLEDPQRDFSLSQMWLMNTEGSNLKTIEVGWRVHPMAIGHDTPRLFIYSTTDTYRSDLYYNLEGPTGFVQTNKNYAIGASRPPSFPSSSVYNGLQLELSVEVVKDPGKGRWRLLVENEEIGYWADEYFGPTFKGSMNTVNWGGEIYTVSKITSSEMGNGHSPDEGYNKAAYIRNLKYIDSSGTTRSIKRKDLKTTENAPYRGSYKYFGSELSFFFGGPVLDTADIQQ